MTTVPELGVYLLVCQHCIKAGLVWREQRETRDKSELLDDSAAPRPDDRWTELPDDFILGADDTLLCYQCRREAEFVPWDALRRHFLKAP